MPTTLLDRTSEQHETDPGQRRILQRVYPSAGRRRRVPFRAGAPGHNCGPPPLRALAILASLFLAGAAVPRGLAQDPVEYYALEDIPGANGGIVGSFMDTYSSNNVYEQITELVAEWPSRHGNPLYTYLTHLWPFEVAAGSLVYSFRLEAHKTESVDNDNFQFSYSTDGQNYTAMLTVTKTADDNSVQVYTFPYPMYGTIYVRVKDTNGLDPKSKWPDTIFIDHMYILAEGIDDQPPVISDVVGTDHASTWYCEHPEVLGGPLLGRERHDMAYDAVADRTVMFGGTTGVHLNDTWIYDRNANTWNNANPRVLEGTLEPRVTHAMVYDASADRIVMFGGLTVSGVTNETWIYSFSANTWSKVEPTVEGGTLEGRWLHAMAYDSTAQRTILFGGATDTGKRNDTWVYDCAGNRWSKLNPSFVGGTLTARNSHAMVYDSAANKTILFGGLDTSGKLNDTWAYDYVHNEWVKQNPSFIGGTLAPRTMHALAYHAAADKTILFGGNNAQTQLGDTWVYDYVDQTWSLAISPAMAGGDLRPREEHAMVYDSSAGRPLLFGGFTNSGCTGCGLNDTWTYGISDRAATITWKTDEPSDSVVRYGPTPGQWTTVSDPALVLDHRVVVENLTPGVEYCYQVESTDAAQNTAIDDNGGLYYRIPDTTAPEISAVAARDVTTASARITWTTDEPADSVVRYGLSPGQWTTVSDSVPATSHSVALSQLSAGTLYDYQVESTDASNNTAIDDNNGSYYTFTTLPANTMHVGAIDMWYTLASGKYRIYTKVTIVDGAGGALSGAVVDLTLTRPGGGSTQYSGTTGSDGTVTFQYGPTKVLGTYTSTVTGVSKAGWTYSYLENNETSESLVVP